MGANIIKRETRNPFQLTCQANFKVDYEKGKKKGLKPLLNALQQLNFLSKFRPKM
jgi:hypothetical protein